MILHEIRCGELADFMLIPVIFRCGRPNSRMAKARTYGFRRGSWARCGAWCGATRARTDARPRLILEQQRRELVQAAAARRVSRAALHCC